MAARYASLADLIARYGAEEINRLADSDHTGTPDPMLVDRVLVDAAAEIDAALVGRYRLPLDPVPSLIVRLACELAHEGLFLEPTGGVKDRATQARKILVGLANGTLRLDGTVAPAEGGSGETDARVQPGRPLMRWPR
jgi:phage gp36-like protein